MRHGWQRLKSYLLARAPHADFWDGGGRALALAGWLLLLTTLVVMSVPVWSVYAFLGLLFGALLLVLLAGLIRLVVALMLRMPPRLRWGAVLFGVVGSVTLGFGGGAPSALAIATLALGALLLGGGLAVHSRRGWGWHALLPSALGATVLTVWLVAFWLSDWPTVESLVWQAMSSEPLDLPDPAAPGPYSVKLVHYGSGADPQRPEFGEAVDYRTETVDGSQLLDGWEGRGGWGRSRYWNASADRLPVNGRAWLPEGEGPFPLVLMVHGNHGMEDFSDPGYAYLGELFASRGVIAVSVDENFLNSSYADLLGIPDVGLDTENDARGWMLLKHLEQWRAWNADAQHPLSGLADLDRVVLIGHSRGGEAVSEAAVFNRLSAYPDDATLAFDFNFGVRGVIAIAPVDTQYHPRDGDTTPTDVSYLVIHGSHDGDVTSYAGYATYSRVRFDDCQGCFKAGFYLLGANHGQFNTGWGRVDMPRPLANWLNLSHLMDGDAQRGVASALFSAFLEVTLNGDDRYRPFLASPDRAPHLLPQGVRYLSQYRDAQELVLADFSEDDDVATGTHDGVTLSAEHLDLWQERQVSLKWHKAHTAAAIVGWQDTDAVASYRLHMPPGLLDPGSSIALTLAASTKSPGEVEEYEAPESIDFSLVLEDVDGRRATLALSQRRPLEERVEPRVFKLHAFQADRSEPVFQRYRFAVGEWLEVRPDLDLSRVDRLSLEFDRTPAASLMISDVTVTRSGY